MTPRVERPRQRNVYVESDSGPDAKDGVFTSIPA